MTFDEIFENDIRDYFWWGVTEEMQCFHFAYALAKMFETPQDAYAFGRILYREGILQHDNLEIKRFGFDEKVYFTSIKVIDYSALDDIPFYDLFEHYFYEILRFPVKCRIVSGFSPAMRLPCGIEIHDTLRGGKVADRFYEIPKDTYTLPIKMVIE